MKHIHFEIYNLNFNRIIYVAPIDRVIQLDAPKFNAVTKKTVDRIRRLGKNIWLQKSTKNIWSIAALRTNSIASAIPKDLLQL